MSRLVELGTLKVPKDKLIGGVPFYGHGFGPSLNDPVIAWMTYKEMLFLYRLGVG